MRVTELEFASSAAQLSPTLPEAPTIAIEEEELPDWVMLTKFRLVFVPVVAAKLLRVPAPSPTREAELVRVRLKGGRKKGGRLSWADRVMELSAWTEPVGCRVPPTGARAALLFSE